MAEHPLEDLFSRLERQRQAADRLYNDALTALDRALQAPPRLPHLSRPHDDERVASLNRDWDILPDGPPAFSGGLKGRLRRFVWRMVGPSLDAQKRFNAALVDHINRNLPAHRQTQESVAALVEIVGREFDALIRFESLLLQFLRTIAAYVDTKDRSVGGSELRERLSLAEQRILVLKRDLETAKPAGQPADGDIPFAGRIDSLTYVGFEDRFRGAQDEIRGRVENYLPLLADASEVVDIGCGRGELLDLLKAHGVSARGVDMNAAMVELCRTRGLDVQQSDAVSFLDRQADGSIGGLTAIQVVEHMEPAYLLRFLETAYHKMRPGAPLILETINPACWMAFFDCYIRDLTHRQPLHPDTLQYLVQASGFSRVDVQHRQPVGAGDRLDRVVPAAGHSVELTGVIAALNAHADKLNARLFSTMDYAVVARR